LIIKMNFKKILNYNVALIKTQLVVFLLVVPVLLLTKEICQNF
jgi:hypothetical protein